MAPNLTPNLLPPTRPSLSQTRYSISSIFRGNGPRKSITPTTPPVFLIPEVLELILLQLPPVAVLTTCRGVCKAWKALIETSPDLKYYSTTGLTRSKQRQYELAAHQLPSQIITPMALIVLNTFWKKLASNGINSRLYVVAERPGVYANNRKRNLCYPVLWLMTLPIQGTICAVRWLAKRKRGPDVEKDRQRVRIDIRQLFKKFGGGTRLIPLIDPDLDRRIILDVGFEEQSNWGYVYRENGIQLQEELPKLDPGDMLPEPWTRVLSMLATTVYSQAPKSDWGENPKFWCDFVYEYLDEKREKKYQTEKMVFGSFKPFNVIVEQPF